MRMGYFKFVAFSSVLSLAGSALAQVGPTITIRANALKSVVYISASKCTDNTSRSGSGFAFGSSGRIVTAHHVVGGCTDIQVRYDGAQPGVDHLKAATISRVFASGDVALLAVDNPPAVPVLAAAAQVDANQAFAGLGYQNSQPTAGDEKVTLSSGSDVLKDILPEDARKQLITQQSAIDLNRHVLRINIALQPGMSGGPIVDAQGAVIGIVAGGLRAGAAPAGWGWPAALIAQLVTSTQKIDQPVRVAGVFYSQNEIAAQTVAKQSGKRVTCGARSFAYHGQEPFSAIVRGADDQPRVSLIIQASMQPRAVIDALRFDLWTDESNGATVVVPAGYALAQQGPLCVVTSSTGPFQEVVWSVDANDPMQIQFASQAFEFNVMNPRVPQFGAQPDVNLAMLGPPQIRDNGMVFNRKAFIHPLAPVMMNAPLPPAAHSFETLIAKSGSFLGVGTINANLPLNLTYCVQSNGSAPGCNGAMPYFIEWTRFILATQLSTYPAT